MFFTISKGGIAVIFFLCMFLPLSRCEVDKSLSPSAPQTQGKSSQEAEKPRSEDFIPIKFVDISDVSSWLFILPFVWPLPLNLLQHRIRTNWAQWILRLLELVLIGYSVYLVHFWATIGTTLFGGYLALICIITYALLFLAENFILLRARHKPAMDGSFMEK